MQRDRDINRPPAVAVAVAVAATAVFLLIIQEGRWRLDTPQSFSEALNI